MIFGLETNFGSSFEWLLKTGFKGAQWLSGRVLDLTSRGRRLEPQGRHCVVSLSKNINSSLVVVQPRKTRPFITERLLMGRKESNETNKKKKVNELYLLFLKFSALGLLQDIRNNFHS